MKYNGIDETDFNYSISLHVLTACAPLNGSRGVCHNPRPAANAYKTLNTEVIIKFAEIMLTYPFLHLL
jgi:hypothetical protein